MLSTAYIPLVGGSELAIKNLSERMEGYDFDMVTGRYSSGVAEEEQIGRVRVFRVGGNLHRYAFLVKKVFLPIVIFYKAWRLTRTYDYALVHAYQASQAAGALWLFSLFLPKLPRLVTVQEGKDLEAQNPWIRWFRKLILKSATAVTVISKHLADYVERETNAPVHIIPNGVALDRFVSRPTIEVMRRVHEHMNVGPHHRVIVSVSRLVPKNGLENLIRALAIVRHEMVHDEPVLVLIGNGELEGELKHLSLLEGVSDHVRFLGTIDHSKLPGYLHASHVFARPSLSEGLGTAFLEAMGASLPVVASRVGGIADFLEDGKTGFVCDPEDPKSIADALLRALRRDEGVKEVVRTALAMVQEKYDWDTSARSMDDVYKKLA